MKQIALDVVTSTS